MYGRDLPHDRNLPQGGRPQACQTKPVGGCHGHHDLQKPIPIPNAAKDLELSIEGPDYFPSQQDLFLGAPFAVTGGHVMVPDAPGWGAEINPDWLDKAA